MIDTYTTDLSVNKSQHIGLNSPALALFKTVKTFLCKSNKKYIRLMFRNQQLINISILKIRSDSFITNDLVKYKVENAQPLVQYPNYFIKDMFLTELLGYPAFIRHPTKILLFDYSKELLGLLNLSEGDFDNRILNDYKT